MHTEFDGYFAYLFLVACKNVTQILSKLRQGPGRTGSWWRPTMWTGNSLANRSSYPKIVDLVSAHLCKPSDVKPLAPHGIGTGSASAQQKPCREKPTWRIYVSVLSAYNVNVMEHDLKWLMPFIHPTATFKKKKIYIYIDRYIYIYICVCVCAFFM